MPTTHTTNIAVFPVHEGPWQDAGDLEFVVQANVIVERDQAITLPCSSWLCAPPYRIQQAPRVQVFEISRFLADVAREEVLATPKERRVRALPELEQILQLEEWHHPNVVEVQPSGSETFQQLAGVLATGMWDSIDHRNHQTLIEGQRLIVQPYRRLGQRSSWILERGSLFKFTR